MKCPKCKKDIAKVIVTSNCDQIAFLSGNEIIAYEDVEQIGETVSIRCPKCDADIKDSIKDY